MREINGPNAYAIRTLRQLAKSGKAISAALIDRLIDGLAKNKSEFCHSALVEIKPQVNAKQLYNALQKAPPKVLSSLIDFPATTNAFRRRVLEKAPNAVARDIRYKLSQLHSAMSDPAIRQSILKSRSGDTLRHAIITVASEDSDIFLSVLRRFVNVSPRLVASLIAQPQLDWASGQTWENRARKEFLEEFVTAVLETNNVEAMEELLKYKKLARNPRLIDALVEHPQTSDNALAYMILYVRGDHFRRVFRRLYTRTSVQEHCVQFIESLISQPPPGLKDLQADDLMPLLQAPDHEVRMRAILLASHLQITSQVPQDMTRTRARS